ncbi:MAG: murein biosynthesis integral membrane protein MurJ [Desulfobacterales bacterium]|nr:murein biosynthesis integral membrane protein MurJ [Desulfobacterales bacterium]MCP4159223.1 murein biosynthesis integral membrane protein MurJ [Deltaproteobacteria bacterium]
MSLSKKVGIASIIMMLSALFSRVAGLVREISIAHIGGADAAVDAYQIAFMLPEVLNHVLASGFLSITFIPIFSYYLENNREADGWKVFNNIHNIFSLLLIILILIAEVFTPQIIKILSPGTKDPETIKKAITMTRIILPAQLFFFSGGLFMAVQYAKEKFFIPALAPVIYNLGIICFGLLLSNICGMEGFSWGVLAGSLIGNFIIQLYGAKKAGFKFSMQLNLKDSELIRYFKVSMPLMVGISMFFSTELFFKFFGSYLDQGSISKLNYAMRVMLILVSLFGQAVGVASYPYLAKLAVEKNIKKMNELINGTVKYLGVVIPFSVLFMILRKEIIFVLFQRGEFKSSATMITSEILLYLMIGTFAFAAQTVVVRGYYAVQNTLLPALLGTISAFLSLPIYYIFMKKMGVNGVALAVSVSAIIQVLLLYLIWNKKTSNKDALKVIYFYGKIIVVSVMIGVGLSYFKSYFLINIDTNSFAGCVFNGIIISALFITLLICSSNLLGIKEVNEVIYKIFSKFIKKKQNE